MDLPVAERRLLVMAAEHGTTIQRGSGQVVLATAFATTNALIQDANHQLGLTTLWIGRITWMSYSVRRVQ